MDIRMEKDPVDRFGIAFCTHCGKYTYYYTIMSRDETIIRNLTIKHNEYRALCRECNNPVYVPEVADATVDDIAKGYKAKLEERTNDLA